MSVTLDGINDKITLSNPSSFNFAKNVPFSYTTWIKTTDTDGVLVDKLDIGGGIFGWQVLIVGSELRAQLRDDRTAPGSHRYLIRYTGGTTFRDGTPRFIAFTYDGSDTAAGLKLYVDGIESTGIIQSNLTGTITNSVPVVFGIRQGLGDFPYAGDMYESAIWDIELTAAQVLDLFKAGIVGKPLDHSAGLIGYYPMDDGFVGISSNGATVRDDSGNGNDGIASGGIWNAQTALSYPGKAIPIIEAVSVPVPELAAIYKNIIFHPVQLYGIGFN